MQSMHHWYFTLVNDLGWTIDVCKTCGKQAIWPFTCGHRPTSFLARDVAEWTMPIQVRPTTMSEKRLRQEMAKRAT